jgi:hypothetical protein
MTFRAKVVALLAGLSFIFMPCAAMAQQSAPSPGAQPAPSAGFVIRGVIHSGSTKLPGVSVTASHSLTGRKVITSTDVDGSFRLDLPSRGRWVLRAELSAFAVQTADLVLTPEQPEATHDFEMILLSRVPKAANPEGEDANDVFAGRQMVTHSPAGAGRGAQQLTVNADDAALAQSAISGDGDLSSANLNGLAASADATNQSVSVSGRMGNAQDFGLQNMDDLRERIQEMRARGQLGDSGFGIAGGGPGGNGVFITGGPGGGGGGGGRMRMGSMTRPHGQIYYYASNGVLDASPYALSGRTEKPGYGSNRFGGMLGGPLKIPHVFDDGGKTFMFLNYSGTRGSTPYDVFSHVPTLAERNGDFSATKVSGLPVQLFDPAHPGTLLGSPVPVSPQAAALLNYIPTPNVFDGSQQNFHFSSAALADSDTFALRLTHNFGAPRQRGTPGMPGAGGGRGGGGRPRNNLNFGLNYQRHESDNLEPFPLVFGNTHTNGFNATAGWALSKGKWSNQFRFTWNRSRSHGNSHFAGESNVAAGALDAGGAGIGYPSFVDPAQNPMIWGLPGLGFSHYTSLGDVAPSQTDSQTFTLSENIGWVHGKHHLHFGGDYRWIDNKAYSSLNPRGAFTFTGSSTAAYAIDPNTGLLAPVAGTGYDFADFLLGYAQQTTLAYSQVHDQYLANSYDLFIQDDWRLKSNLTLNLGLRYEFISPFNESHNQLENLITHFDTAGNFTGATVVYPNQAGQAYPRALVHPDRNNFAPRVGVAWKPFGAKTVVRAGYGINYNLAQYASIVHSLAAHPPCADTSTPCAVTQTNGNTSPTGPSPFTLANGFSAQSSTITNNYGIDPNYRVAYVQLWTLNVQHEITPTLLLNVGYTGSKGSALDMLRAPNRGPTGAIVATVDPFNWETSQGSSILHAGSVRLRKRMTRGVAIGGTYTYSKSIDNASSIGGGTQVVAQDDRNLRAERGLSSFDQRHKLTGDWTLELPWGEGRKWLTRPGVTQEILGDWLLQSSFTVASGTPYTARVLGSYSDVAGGTNGSLRANYTGQPIQLSHRTKSEWFNAGSATPGSGAFCTGASGARSCVPFGLPTTGYGNAGRNTIIGPGSWLMSLVLSKNIPLKDSMGIEMRAEADNVLNHANYSGIDTVVNSPTFGQVTSVASMRKMILSMRYRF